MKRYIISLLAAIFFMSPCMGFGATPSPMQMTEWCRDAAQGQVYAQFNLGVVFAQGQGVPQDYTEAIKWYLLAAQQGNTDAQFNLGLMYTQGQGVPQSYAEEIADWKGRTTWLLASSSI